jgi:hypothetical protein
MARRPLVVTTSTVALILFAGTPSPSSAAPPPPPPSEGMDRPSTAPPPPSSSSGGSSSGGGQAQADPLAVQDDGAMTDLSGVWTYSRSAGRAPNYVVGEDEDDLYYTVNPVGYYQGVSVGGGNLPPFAPKEVGGDSAVLTWTGFERADHGSRVFFQLSTAVAPEIEVSGMRVFVKLPRTSVKIRNNRRKLITKYFKTPINDIQINRSGKDVLIVLELRWEATPTWRFEAGANGFQVLVVEFADAPEDGPKPPAPPGPPAKASEGSGDQPFLPTD